MGIPLSAAMVAILYLCSCTKLSLTEDPEKVCFSIVQEGRLETIEGDIKIIKGMLGTKKLGFCGCNNYLVSGIYGVTDDKITASSNYNNEFGTQRARLYDLSDRTSKGAGGWCPKASSNREYIQVELKGISRVTGIVTQGRHDHLNRMTSYKVLYSDDGSTWSTIQDELAKDRVFTGNSDRDTLVTHHLDWPIEARFVRLQILTWHNHICMRFDVLGCPAGQNKNK